MRVISLGFELFAISRQLSARVADLSADAQARLLRFLHDRMYERLGETKERKADVRIIAATNRGLEDEVRAGRFREDLFFRLNVITFFCGEPI
jgi:NtrC-family two-component system response regulator AlgB